MKYILVLLISCLLGLGHTASGQTTKKIDISVKDNAQKPASGTLVELVNADNLTTVKFAITAADGSVEFSKVTDGNYIVFIPSVNGINYTSSVLKLNSGTERIKLSVITLNKAADNAVTIMGKAGRIATAS